MQEENSPRAPTVSFPEAVEEQSYETDKEDSVCLWNVSKLSAKNTSNGYEIFPIQNFCVA